MEGFKAIEEYTDGFIKAPSRDKVEIRHDGSAPDYSINFEITDEGAWAAEWANDYDEIIKSAGGATKYAEVDTRGELVSSVQGGDNEAPNVVSVVTGANKITEYDKIWGKFNYKKREPGSRMVSPHWTDRNPYGFLFETRSWDEIVRLGKN